MNRLLEDRGVRAETPDLPSHHRLDAGLGDDAEEVRAVIRSAPDLVVVVGWSYGGDRRYRAHKWTMHAHEG